eukprot:TRINITY_DN3483_c0_g3_i1.p1 TRINITY_DN3483_c0_g3~~TRINITY_DN3483_c0_g3_i1.p1  ORF type:complete len:364 (+),score=47.85 TRINITY_DN3483_c0_g3_i1:69-1094(+)
MVFLRVRLVWVVIALAHQRDCCTGTRNSLHRHSHRHSAHSPLKKIVAIDWDETLTRVTVGPDDFPADSPDWRFNNPMETVNMLTQEVDEAYHAQAQKQIASLLKPHLWYEFAGVFDGLEGATAEESNSSRVSASEWFAFPSRVSKLKDFLQTLADAGNIAVVVLSNTRKGPETIVAKLKYLGLDVFFNGVFAGVPNGNRKGAKMMYMRKRKGSWFPRRLIMDKYDLNKTRILNLLTEHPEDYLSGRYFGGWRRHFAPSRVPTTMLPQDVLLIDDAETNCKLAAEAGFQAFHVNATEAMEPQSKRTAAGFGAGPDFELDFGCHAGYPLSLLELCKQKVIVSL